jgi:hypothetical protein
MLAFCQKLITLASCLENVVWFPVSASLKTGFKLHLFRLSKIPLVEDPACGAGRGGVMRGGVRPVRMQQKKDFTKEGVIWTQSYPETRF